MYNSKLSVRKSFILLFIYSQIQIRLKRCNNDRALCNCGIAARVGQDIYKMDFCDTDSMFLNYVSCGDNVLKVKSNKEYKYKVCLSIKQLC